MTAASSPAPTDAAARRLTRLAAVQGLYQLALSPEDPNKVLRRFKDDATAFLQEDEALDTLDKDLASAIIDGAYTQQVELDALIAGVADARLNAERMEPLLKSILRAGAYELKNNKMIPVAMIVNDYIEVAHGFFDAKEPGLVNALLDRLAKSLRAE